MNAITLAIPQGAKIGPDARPIYGFVEVQASEERGLAVHKTGKGARWKWMVSHVSSGLALERIGAMTKAAAMDHMRRALDLPIDWTRPEQEIFAIMRSDRRILDGINEIANHN